jgi:predicted 3-demethylubiquinone-9 3-methyltransferase (glyoxalase superfamily)
LSVTDGCDQDREETVSDIQFTPEFIQQQRSICEAANLTPAEIKDRPDGFLLKRAFIENSHAYYTAALDEIERLSDQLEELRTLLFDVNAQNAGTHFRDIFPNGVRNTKVAKYESINTNHLREAFQSDDVQILRETLVGVLWHYSVTSDRSERMSETCFEKDNQINALARALTQTGERLEAAEQVCQKAVTWGNTRHTKTPDPDTDDCPGCKATGELVDELEKWFESYGRPKEQDDGKQPTG